MHRILFLYFTIFLAFISYTNAALTPQDTSAPSAFRVVFFQNSFYSGLNQTFAPRGTPMAGQSTCIYQLNIPGVGSYITNQMGIVIMLYQEAGCDSVENNRLLLTLTGVKADVIANSTGTIPAKSVKLVKA